MSEKTNPNSIGVGHTLSFVVLGAALLAFFGSAWYADYAERKRAEAELPRLALQSLMADVRRFHARSGRFPASLAELREGPSEKGAAQPRGEPDGQSFITGYYYYRYAPVGPHAATVWAVPIGPRRAEASTTFLVVSKDSYTLWKGPALDAEQCRALRANPSAVELAALGLTRQPATPEGKQPPSSATARR